MDRGKAEGYLPEIPGRGAGAAGGPFALLLLPTGKSSGQERQTSDDTQLYSLEETERRMAQPLGRMSGVGRVQVMLSLKTGPTLQLAQDMDLEQEGGQSAAAEPAGDGEPGQRLQGGAGDPAGLPSVSGSGGGVSGGRRQCRASGGDGGRGGADGLSTEKITVVQWEQ